MTERLYYKDRYATSISAAVTASGDGWFRLDRTIFYPEAGGQPGDRGTFGPYSIVDTQKAEDGDVLHLVGKGSAVPSVGETHTLSLDWEHRYFFMKEHSAQHLVSALLFSCFSIGTVAVHQGDMFFTVETDKAEIDEETLLSVEDKANEAIRKGAAVWQDETDHESAESLHMRRSIKVQGRVMLVHIDGIDVVACGGVHVASLSEIGEIAYVSSEKIRGHVRTYWKCAERAVGYRRENAAIVRSLSSLFSAEPGNIEKEAARCIAEVKSLRHDLGAMSEKLSFYLFAAAVAETKGGEPVIFISDAAAAAFDSVVRPDEDRTVLIADREGRFLFQGPEKSFEALKAALPGLRGGGRNGRYRGSFQMDAESFISGARNILDGNGSTERA